MRVLIADDNPEDRLIEALAVRQVVPNALVDEVDSHAAVVDALGRQHYDLVLIDVVMPGGMRASESVRYAQRRSPVVAAVTGHPDLAPGGCEVVAKGEGANARLADLAIRAIKAAAQPEQLAVG